MALNGTTSRVSGLTGGVRQFAKFLPLLWELVKRDFKAKYKRSYLGIIWTILRPLATMLVMNLIFSNLLGRNVDNFPVYLMCGMLVMSFNSEATSMSMNSLIGGRMLFSARLPIYMIPLSRVLSSLINALLSLAALLVVMWITGMRPAPGMLFFPLPLIYIALYAFGVGMLLACGMVFFRDLAHLYGIFLTLLQYMTPVFYAESVYPERYLYLFQLNPMYHFVKMFRSVMMYGALPSAGEHLICLTYGVVAILIGAAVMRRNKDAITTRV